MFDLEKAIADWRQDMLAAGIKTPVPLEELEIHLRDDIERQIRSGANLQQAFEKSVRQIGRADELKSEFRKICRMKCNSKWSWLQIGCFGLAVTAVLNLLGRFVFHRSSSVFLSYAWWAAWLPNYIVWTSFILIGLALSVADGRSQRRATKQ